MPFVSVQFRSLPVKIDPVGIPFITDPMTKTIAETYVGKVPAFIAPSENLIGRIKSLEALEKEFEAAEKSEKENEQLILQFQKEVKSIDQFLDEKVDTLKALKADWEKTEKEYLVKSQEQKEFRKSAKKANQSLEEKIASIDSLREDQFAQTENSQILLALLKTAVSIMLAAAGIFGGVLMRRTGLALQRGFLVAGGLFSSASLGLYFSKEARQKIDAVEKYLDSSQPKAFFDEPLAHQILSLLGALPLFEVLTRTSRLESAHERLALAISEKAKRLDWLKENDLRKKMTALEEEQDKIIKEGKSKEDRREEIEKDGESALKKLEIAQKKIEEIPEKQHAIFEEIKKEISKEDLLSCSKYFQNLEKELQSIVKELEDARFTISISHKEEPDRLRDAKAQIREKAQFAGIALKELDAAFAEEVLDHYKAALEQCSRVLKFLESIDPCDDPETPEFYDKCEELLKVFSQKISSFALADKNMTAFFQRMKFSYPEDLSKLMGTFKKTTGGNPKGMSDVLKGIHEKSAKIVSLLKQGVEDEDDDDELEELREKIPTQFELFFFACDELRKIYEKSMKSCNPQSNKYFEQFNTLHQRFCEAMLEVILAGKAIAERFDCGDEIEKVQEDWKKITG